MGVIAFLNILAPMTMIYGSPKKWEYKKLAAAENRKIKYVIYHNLHKFDITIWRHSDNNQ